MGPSNKIFSINIDSISCLYTSSNKIFLNKTNGISDYETLMVYGKIEEFDSIILQSILNWTYKKRKKLVINISNSEYQHYQNGLSKKMIKGSCCFDFLYGTPKSEKLTKYQYEKLIIAAHGEGIHLSLNDSVYCSFRNKENKQNEKDCNYTYCRRFNDNFKKVLKAGDILCRDLYLLSCNSGCFDGSLYESPYSLIDGFFSHGTQTIVSCIEIYEYDKEIIDLVSYMVDNNYSPPVIAMILNDISYKRTGRCPFVTLTTQKEERYEKYKKTNALSKLEIIPISDGKKDSIFCIPTSSDLRLQVWRGYYALYLRGVTNSNIVLQDYKNKIGKLLLCSIKLIKRIQSWQILFNRFDCKIEGTRLFELSKDIEEIIDLLTNFQFFGYCDLHSFESCREKLVQKAYLTQLLLVKIIIEKMKIESFDRMLSHSLPKLKKQEICNRDNSIVYSYQCICNDFSLIAEYCMLCGIKRISVKDYSFFYVVDSNDNVITVNYSLSNKENYYISRNVIAYVELFDKAKQIVSFRKVFSKMNLSGSFSFQMPTEKGDDLHTIRIIMLHDLIPFYIRERVL